MTGEQICVVHYVGDETLSVPGPHGNSDKQAKLFFRTKPSVREDAFQRAEKEKAHVVYKEMVVENKEGHDAISKPRDIRQLHNARASKKEEIRLSKDAIINTHEIIFRRVIPSVPRSPILFRNTILCVPSDLALFR